MLFIYRIQFFKVINVKNHNLFIIIVWNLATFLTLKNAYFHGKFNFFSYVQLGELCFALAPGGETPHSYTKGGARSPVPASYGPECK